MIPDRSSSNAELPWNKIVLSTSVPISHPVDLSQISNPSAEVDFEQREAVSTEPEETSPCYDRL